MLFQHAVSVTRRALTLSAISLLLIGAYSDAFAQEEKSFSLEQRRGLSHL